MRTIQFKNRYCKCAFYILIGILAYLLICFTHSTMYDIDTYCCRHMSRDIEDTLEAIGIPVIIVTGANDYNERHMWIRIGIIDVDSVSLLPFLSPYSYPRDMKFFNDYDDYL